MASIVVFIGDEDGSSVGGLRVVGRGGNWHRSRTQLPLLALFPLRWWDHPMIMMRPWLLSLWDDADWFLLVVPMRDFYANIVVVVVVVVAAAAAAAAVAGVL